MGEKDPAVFRRIREEFPARVREIIIRVVADEDEENRGRLDNMTLIPTDQNTDESCSEYVEAAAD